jgi:hypothetical protein
MCPTFSSPADAVKDFFSFFVIIFYSKLVKNMIKVTNCNELEIKLNFILSSEALRLAATNTSGQSNSILVGSRIKNENSFSDSNDESRLFYILSKKNLSKKMVK